MGTVTILSVRELRAHLRGKLNAALREIDSALAALEFYAEESENSVYGAGNYEAPNLHAAVLQADYAHRLLEETDSDLFKLGAMAGEALKACINSTEG